MPWSFRQMLAPLSALLLFMSACGDDPEVRPVCGNGIVEAGETCDDGNRNNNDSCDNSCRRPTPDAGTEEDAGTEDDAGTGEVDAGTGEEDAGTGEDDAGTTEDAGTGEDDAGTTEDAGTGEDDAGTTEDGGSGEQDAGSDEDGGSGEPDSGTDAGTGEDDAGTDAGTVQVSLDSFGPTGTFARTGTTGATFPEALTVRLREEAPAEVWVEVTSSSAVLNVQGGLVRIAPGERSATVQVTANLAADPETDKATLTATLGNDTRAATVRVLAANQAAELATLSPEVISVSAGQTQGYTVELDVPPAQDTVIQLALEPASLGTVPVTVTVPANSLSAKFDFTAGSTGGEGQLVAALNGQSIAAAVQVTAGSSTGHVVISEFAVAGPGGASDEFIELYNPTSSAVDISGWKVQYKAYSSTNYNNSFTLPANSVIQPRGYFLVVASGYASTSGNTVSGDANWGTALNLAANSNGGHVRVGYPELALTDGISSPLVVDTVGYLNANAAEGSPLPAYPPTAGSFERKASAVSTAASMVDGADALLGNGHDSNDNSADFILRPTRQPQNRASATEP
ncbi:putative lipoprotein [Myxococcus xanthus DK 1622]|uniref:Lipoprotein n=1 Tax=Myxococcus xanthus (strain DK1622) TaxID=246197 RepID=Q1D5C2_MYXXD|nr:MULTISPECIES: lamin tail domain-containing protein [Myxococcus]ABF88347.1 putative lipoprotein [Myxococcus xanthus DK 1622]NOJ52829.1 hypothetical protein [Myxococcus xanthus]QPM76594.1 lamin tail domain-containing protein [Myxococcus xanthus]QVW65658.1 lamin tail domain-containing protein [Myxococcus xanthus DZ2]QZZ51661.1 hypothetical protein MyxoNM_20880 [Myxococcus xanthus]